MACCECAYQRILVKGDQGHNDRNIERGGQVKVLNGVVKEPCDEMFQATEWDYLLAEILTI